jgi:hypothetical protein
MLVLESRQHINMCHVALQFKISNQLTYLLTYLLTELSPSWEAASYAAIQEIHSI